jgi:hypothetical protein
MKHKKTNTILVGVTGRGSSPFSFRFVFTTDATDFAILPSFIVPCNTIKANGSQGNNKCIGINKVDLTS